MKASRLIMWTVGAFTLIAGFAFAEVSLELTNPLWGASYAVCSDIPFEVNVETTAAEGMREVRYYYNGANSIGASQDEPFGYTWEEVPAGNYWIHARARDRNNDYAYSDTILIKVGDLYHGDLIINGGFDCLKTWPWKLFGYEGGWGTMEAFDDGMFDDDSYLYVDVTQAGTAEWHLQLQHAFPISAEHTYIVEFFAAADGDKPINFTFQQNADPYIEYFHQDLEVGGIDYYGPYTFDCEDDDPGALFKFNIANNLIDFYLDAVSVIDESISSVKAIGLTGNGVSSFSLYNAYPNPFNMNVTIPHELTQPGEVTLSIYDVNGRHVKTLFAGSQAPGIHSVRWNGTNSAGQIMPSGVYFIRMDTGIGNRTSQLSRKILLMK